MSTGSRNLSWVGNTEEMQQHQSNCHVPGLATSYFFAPSTRQKLVSVCTASTTAGPWEALHPLCEMALATYSTCSGEPIAPARALSSVSQLEERAFLFTSQEAVSKWKPKPYPALLHILLMPLYSSGCATCSACRGTNLARNAVLPEGYFPDSNRVLGDRQLDWQESGLPSCSSPGTHDHHLVHTCCRQEHSAEI